MLYSAKIVGYLVYLDPSFPDRELYAKNTFFNKYTKRMEKSYAPVFVKKRDTKEKLIGLGAFMRIFQEAPLLFTLESFNPPLSPINDIPLPEGLKLRPYQQECMDVMLRHKGGIIRLPTGTGKGTIKVAYASKALSLGHVLILVPTRPALDTIIARCKQYNLPVMEYSKSREGLLTQNTILVTVPKSLDNDCKDGNNYFNRENIRTVLADECHHLAAKTWQTIFLGLSSVQRSFGFSATIAEIGKNIMDTEVGPALMVSYTGPIIYSRTAKDPDVRPYIDIPDVYEIVYTWDEPIKGNNATKIAEAVECNLDRHKFIAKIVNEIVRCKYTCLSIVARTKSTASQFAYFDHPSVKWLGGGDLQGKDVVIEGDNPLEFVQKNIRSHIWSIVATNHLNESVDISDIDVAILSENVGSTIIVQRSGRTVRPGSKKSAVINIFDDNSGVLRSQSYKRRLLLEKEYGVKSRTITIEDIKNYFK